MILKATSDGQTPTVQTGFREKGKRPKGLRKMAFHQDRFLGQAAGASDVQALVDELSDKVLHLDGSKSMAGTLAMSSNVLLGAGVVQVIERGAGVLPPAGQISLYGKADKRLYQQDDTGTETILDTGTGDVTSAGVLASSRAVRTPHAEVRPRTRGQARRTTRSSTRPSTVLLPPGRAFAAP